MPLPEMDSSVGHTFGLEIDGVTIKQITEVSGLSMEQDVIELKENTAEGKYVIKKLPGREKAGQVTFKRGLTDDTSFEKWIKDARFGKMPDARKSGAVVVYDHNNTALKRYTLTNAWPSKLEIGTLKAGDTSVLTETLTVVYEQMAPA